MGRKKSKKNNNSKVCLSAQMP